MNAKQLTEVKRAFKKLEEVVSSITTVNGVSSRNDTFRNAFADAWKALGVLENDEEILQGSQAEELRDQIRETKEEIEVIQSYNDRKFPPIPGETLADRFNHAKDSLTNVNQRLSGMK